MILNTKTNHILNGIINGLGTEFTVGISRYSDGTALLSLAPNPGGSQLR